jgi:hypothetical protein
LRPLSSSEITMSLPKPGRGRATAFTALRDHGAHPVRRWQAGYAPRTWVTLTFLAAPANQRRLELALGGADKLAQCAFDLANLLGVFQRVLGVVHIHNADHDFLARAMSPHRPLVCQRAIEGHARRGATAGSRGGARLGTFEAVGTCFFSKWYSHSMSVLNLGLGQSLIHSVCPSTCGRQSKFGVNQRTARRPREARPDSQQLRGSYNAAAPRLHSPSRRRCRRRRR